jgi:hypothetical protein
MLPDRCAAAPRAVGRQPHPDGVHAVPLRQRRGRCPVSAHHAGSLRVRRARGGTPVRTPAGPGTCAPIPSRARPVRAGTPVWTTATCGKPP